ncbi:MAG: hypothetical protein AAF799_05470 [Myxococcota bacterium]
MRRTSIAFPLPILLSWACGPDTVASTSNGDNATETSDPTGSTSASAASTSNGSAPSVDSSSGAADTVAETTMGIDPDTGPAECDIYAQDCPKGEKCTIWANDGGDAVNATRCVPVVDDPVAPGDPCVIEGGPASGIDDCAHGAYCWDGDPTALEGICVDFCSGSEDDPFCDDPDTACIISADFPPICRRTCNPLESDCQPDEGCYPINDYWLCADVNWDAGYGEACDFPYACLPGLVCQDSELVAGCEKGAAGCCTDLCNLVDPMCQAAKGGAMCEPWFEEAPPGYENVGVCVLPPP